MSGAGPGCLVLTDKTSGLRYHLIGGNLAVIKDGANVTVVGVVLTRVLSYCMDGQNFEVISAKSN